MAGATWNERGEGDWLASNGRWYPPSAFPKGWSYSSLPPAPHHRGDSMLKSAGAPGRIAKAKKVVPFPDKIVNTAPQAKALPPPPDNPAGAPSSPSAPKNLPAPPRTTARPPAPSSRPAPAPPPAAPKSSGSSSSPFDSIKRRVEQAIEDAIE